MMQDLLCTALLRGLGFLVQLCRVVCCVGWVLLCGLGAAVWRSSVWGGLLCGLQIAALYGLQVALLCGLQVAVLCGLQADVQGLQATQHSKLSPHSKRPHVQQSLQARDLITCKQDAPNKASVQNTCCRHAQSLCEDV